MMGRKVRVIRSEAELAALPQDAIVGKGDSVYQRIHTDAEGAAIGQDGYGNPAVWAGIAFDNDPEYLSSGAVWHSLAECYEGCGNPPGSKCDGHRWVEVWHEGMTDAAGVD